jgi:hypothetical protein
MLPFETRIFMSTNEISFGLDPGQRFTTQADFTYKITPDTISIVELERGDRALMPILDLAENGLVVLCFAGNGRENGLGKVKGGLNVLK